MAKRRLTCPQCPTYDREAHRCRIGKANPRRKHESLTVAELLGARALCLHNPYREPLLLRMYQPKRRFLWESSTLPLQSPPIEIEILDEEET